jgi:hypothetical protein
MRGSAGLSVHWTSQSVLPDGRTLPFAEAVGRFDVERFAGSLEAVGAKHCIFTLTHAEQFLALPHPLLEDLLPGRTTERDLIGELIEALAARGIRFIAYYNHSCNGDNDPVWRKACGYDAGNDGNLDLFAARICMIVEVIARRYGRKLSGWWFDSSYSVDPRGPHNSVTCGMDGWQFPWAMLAAAAKSGNPGGVVTFNAGIGEKFLYSDHQDYYAGEVTWLDDAFRQPENVMQDHRWICIDSPEWLFCRRNCRDGFAGELFDDDALGTFLDGHLGSGNMVTFNLQIDQSGLLNPNALRQIVRIRSSAVPPVAIC